ncbi:MAG: hypothetical protein KF809_18815 [Chloroflexi bacterium]|nr:hypothetical protein [Chloroflexota bacterium]
MHPVTAQALITDHLEDLRSEARRVRQRGTSSIVGDRRSLRTRASRLTRHLTGWRLRVTLGPVADRCDAA